jgi:hypothetical protein
MKRTTLALVIAASLTASACLQKDTTSTIYLRQDGSFDWVVLEQNVYSDDGDAATRAREESEYVGSAARGEHGVASGFSALGGDDIRVRVLRDTRPYAVMVDARFDGLSNVLDRILAGCGIPHDVGMTRDGDVTTWRLAIDAGPDGETLAGGGLDGCDDAVDDLAMSDALKATVMLESGAFTSATGFKLEGSTRAVLDEESLKATFEASGRIELSLSWTAR